MIVDYYLQVNIEMGFNIQVSKSEGEDVGALENALGNSKALINTSGDNPVPVDFSVLAGHATGTLKSIGFYSDVVSSTIFVFLTNYTDPTFPGSFNVFFYLVKLYIFL